MRIGIIGAMSEETEKLINAMEVQETIEKAQMVFKKGILYNREAVVVTSGIGKVNAAICTQILVDDFHIDYVINVGIAGGAQEQLYPGDIVIGKELVQHDMDATFFDYKLGQIPRVDTHTFRSDENLVELAKEATKNIKDYKCYEGVIASGDQFVATKEKLEWLNENFSAFACEMEGASIAHVAYLNHVPFIVIRSISDNAINGTHLEYDKFKWIAVENSVNIIESMLKSTKL